ncbi:MAG: hypothetical protein KBT22_03340 [Bacteroidales bacterium]|nr:hypothetical protein [Candidatus Scybalocola fimicaballi]
MLLGLLGFIGTVATGALGGAAVGALAGAFFDWLDEQSLADEISDNYDNVTRFKIDKKRFHNGSYHMDIGLFEKRKKVGKIEDLQAKEVSKSLYQGKVVYID